MVRTSSVIHTRTDASPGQSPAPCVRETMWQRPPYSPVSPATQLAEGLKPREALTPMGSVFPGENSLRCSQPWTMRYHGDLGNLDVERSAGRNTASPQRQTPAPLSRRVYPQASEEAWAVSGLTHVLWSVWRAAGRVGLQAYTQDLRSTSLQYLSTKGPGAASGPIRKWDDVRDTHVMQFVFTDRN